MDRVRSRVRGGSRTVFNAPVAARSAAPPAPAPQSRPGSKGSPYKVSSDISYCVEGTEKRKSVGFSSGFARGSSVMIVRSITLAGLSLGVSANIFLINKVSESIQTVTALVEVTVPLPYAGAKSPTTL